MEYGMQRRVPLYSCYNCLEMSCLSVEAKPYERAFGFPDEWRINYVDGVKLIVCKSEKSNLSEFFKQSKKC